MVARNFNQFGPMTWGPDSIYRPSPEWEEYRRRIMNPGAERGWYDYPNFEEFVRRYADIGPAFSDMRKFVGAYPGRSYNPVATQYGPSFLMRTFPLSRSAWGQYLLNQPEALGWVRQQMTNTARNYAQQRTGYGQAGRYLPRY
jgi:hypothetical protein